MTRNPGRPRSERSRLAILAATRELLREHGYERMTVEAIAERAGAGKQTIYRGWGSKAGVVADAVVSGVLPLSTAPLPRKGSLRDDLIGWLRGVVRLTNDPVNRSVIRALAATAAADGGPSPVFDAAVVKPVGDQIRARLAAARADGDLREGVDDDLVVDVIIGTLTMASLGPTKLDASRVAVFVDSLLDGIGAPKRP